MHVESMDAATAERRQRRAAAWLRGQGVGEADRVAIAARSSLDYLALALGALRVGIIPVLVNPVLTVPEREYIIGDAQPILVLDDGDVSAVGETLAAGDADEAALAPAPRSRPMLYTSGTTGRPKGVWTGLLSAFDAAALVQDEAELWGFCSDDRHLVVSPMYHSAPFRFAAGTLLAGGTVGLAPGSSTEALAGAVAAFAPTTAFVAPVHLARLLAADPMPDLSSFRLVAHAGAPCPSALKQRALALLPAGSVWEFYGSTEGQFTVCPPEVWRAHPGTVGRARPGRELEVDDDGTIWCRPPGFARFSYWRDEPRTAAAWRDGAFTVGDLGRLDEDGFLYLDGRRDDLIISGGVNVYPLEVERVLLEHPDVEDAAVFPIDDESWGQLVAVAVTGPAPDAEPDLREFVASRLAPFKRPKRWVFVEEIPHTSTGKTRRSHLARELGLSP